MIKSEYVIYGFILFFILILVYILFNTQSYISLSQNIHHYLSYDINTEKINCYSDNTFYRKLNSVYMSQTVKTNIVTTINDFIKNSDKFKKNNIPRSLRIILSGQEGIGKRTLIEALSTEINYRIIHFPKNEYSEKMLHTFFMNLNNIINSNNIIVFDNIDFNYIYQNNSHLYILLSELIIKNDNEIAKTILIVKKNRMKFLNEIKSFRSQILKVNDPNNLNNIFKIKKIKSNPYKTLLYLNKNFLLKKDNRIVNGNNFHLVKKYNFKSKSFDIIHLINKILLRSEFNKHLNVTKILNEKNFNEDFLYKKNLQIGLFKLKIFTKKSLFLNYHRSIAQFLLTNKQINNVYTLMKI